MVRYTHGRPAIRTVSLENSACCGRLDAEIRFTYLPSNLVVLEWLPFNFLGPTILLEIQIIVITRLARIFGTHQSHLGPKVLLEGAKSSLKFETSLLKSKFIQSLMVDNSLLNKLYGFTRLGLLWNLGMIYERCNTAKRSWKPVENNEIKAL